MLPLQCLSEFVTIGFYNLLLFVTIWPLSRDKVPWKSQNPTIPVPQVTQFFRLALWILVPSMLVKVLCFQPKQQTLTVPTYWHPSLLDVSGATCHVILGRQSHPARRAQYNPITQCVISSVLTPSYIADRKFLNESSKIGVMN